MDGSSQSLNSGAAVPAVGIILLLKIEGRYFMALGNGGGCEELYVGW